MPPNPTLRPLAAGDALTPRERIVRLDVWTLLHNAEAFLQTGARVVELACGHVAHTNAVRSVGCPRCTEMLRRSLRGEEDYESFRAGRTRDQMEWPDDPCRALNEAAYFNALQSEPQPMTPATQAGVTGLEGE